MKKAVIITAGGIGNRMKQNTPKQFIEIGSIPILMLSIKAFYLFDDKIQIVITLPLHAILEWEKLVNKHGFEIPHQLVAGGETRFHSIQNALPYVQSADFVAIHDGVRPFVSQEMIQNAFIAAHDFDVAIPVNPVTDSIRILKDEYLTFVDRNSVYSVQTPQCFRTEKITEAYQLGYKSDFTDDGSVYENCFGKLHFYPGIPENIKITNPADLIIASALSEFFKNNASFPQFG
ncbi:MAG: 2-C-methyl-D-erythritol 4-phosphate cytidylyltransferase [Bacteroidales bacterium]|nr:2-C-methyl-D-erythritol 4-phosphate cytidylyltransferase [Bacteroidales bacterium]MDY0215346.1 2-C-methyl-D-erythritol 4-phosphate cytidylyltransferase [Bacteroidales bacterium]